MSVVIKHILARIAAKFYRVISATEKLKQNTHLQLISDWQSLNEGDQILVCSWSQRTRVVLISKPSFKNGYWHFLGADKVQGTLPHKYLAKSTLFSPCVVFWRSKKATERCNTDFFRSLQIRES